MPGNPPAPVDEDFDTVELLSSVPIGCYQKRKDLYLWPQKNKCPLCGKGKYWHLKETAILVCRKCGSELHIPHEA